MRRGDCVPQFRNLAGYELWLLDFATRRVSWWRKSKKLEKIKKNSEKLKKFKKIKKIQKNS
jgi:hypothetical protein